MYKSIEYIPNYYVETKEDLLIIVTIIIIIIVDSFF